MLDWKDSVSFLCFQSEYMYVVCFQREYMYVSSKFRERERYTQKSKKSVCKFLSERYSARARERKQLSHTKCSKGKYGFKLSLLYITGHHRSGSMSVTRRGPPHGTRMNRICMHHAQQHQYPQISTAPVASRTFLAVLYPE
jgi:hypothetical protein